MAISSTLFVFAALTVLIARHRIKITKAINKLFLFSIIPPFYNLYLKYILNI